MLFGMFERDRIRDFGAGGSASQQDKKQNSRYRPVPIGVRVPSNHRPFASQAISPAELSFLSNFSHKPSKLPLDMINSKSPCLASLTRCSAIASELGNTRASFPSLR